MFWGWGVLWGVPPVFVWWGLGHRGISAPASSSEGLPGPRSSVLMVVVPRKGGGTTRRTGRAPRGGGGGGCPMFLKRFSGWCVGWGVPPGFGVGVVAGGGAAGVEPPRVPGAGWEGRAVWRAKTRLGEPGRGGLRRVHRARSRRVRLLLPAARVLCRPWPCSGRALADQLARTFTQRAPVTLTPAAG